jgi:hypothetical protein
MGNKFRVYHIDRDYLLEILKSQQKINKLDFDDSELIEKMLSRPYIGPFTYKDINYYVPLTTREDKLNVPEWLQFDFNIGKVLYGRINFTRAIPAKCHNIQKVNLNYLNILNSDNIFKHLKRIDRINNTFRYAIQSLYATKNNEVLYNKFNNLIRKFKNYSTLSDNTKSQLKNSYDPLRINYYINKKSS